MKEKNNRVLIWIIIILIMLVLGLIGYIVNDKEFSDNRYTGSKTSNIKQDNENNIINYDIDEKMVSLEDLNLNIYDNFKVNYSVKLNGENKTLTIENNYTIVKRNIDEIIRDKNEITFYINNIEVYKHTQTCDPTSCTKTLNNIGIFNNKYLAISLLDGSANGFMVEKEELHLFDLDKEVATIDSIYFNKNIELKGNYIYYYADENNNTTLSEKIKVYKYRKTIEDAAEKLDYLYEVDCYSGTVNQ